MPVLLIDTVMLANSGKLAVDVLEHLQRLVHDQLPLVFHVEL